MIRSFIFATFLLAAPIAALAPASTDGGVTRADAHAGAHRNGSEPPKPTAPPSAPAHMGFLKSSSAAPIPMARGAAFTYKLFAGNATTAPGDILELTMTTPVPEKYVALGMSARHMTGLLLFCFVSPTRGECEIWAGDKHDVSRMRSPPTVHIQSSRLYDDRAGYEVTVRVAASDFGVVSGRQRIITAVGPYDAATKTPHQHGDDDYSHLEVDFSTGAVELPRTKYFMWIAIVVDVFVAVVYCAVATMLHRCTRVMVRPRVWSCMNAATMATLVLMCAVVGVGRALDATADLQPTPWARGFAAAGVTGGVITLFPTPKFFNPGWLFGATYERLIPFHRVSAVVLVVGATVHTGMAMYALPKLSDMLLTSGYNNNLLAGLIAWVCFFMVTVSSVFGLPRRKMFWLWRLVHCLFVPGYVACVMHYPPMLFGLALPLLLFVCDVIARGLAVALTGAKIKSVRVFEKADVVEVDIELTGCLAPSSVSPGDFVHMGFMTTSNWALHPFTIAWYDADAKVATFYIKALSTSWTGKLLECATATPEKLLGTRVLWIGPCGTLQVPLGRVPNVVLVSGGIGVTPMLATLQYLASAAARGGTNAVQGPNVGGGDTIDKCVFVWAVRGDSMIEALRPRIEQAARIANAEVLVFDTSKTTHFTGLPAFDTEMTSLNSPTTQPGADSNAARLARILDGVNSPPVPRQEGESTLPYRQQVGERHVADDDDGPRFTIASGRPDVPVIMRSRFAKGMRVALYVCGPNALVESCYAAARERPATFLHQETFDV